MGLTAEYGHRNCKTFLMDLGVINDANDESNTHSQRKIHFQSELSKFFTEKVTSNKLLQYGYQLMCLDKLNKLVLILS